MEVDGQLVLQEEVCTYIRCKRHHQHEAQAIGPLAGGRVQLPEQLGEGAGRQPPAAETFGAVQAQVVAGEVALGYLLAPPAESPAQFAGGAVAPLGGHLADAFFHPPLQIEEEFAQLPAQGPAGQEAARPRAALGHEGMAVRDV